LSPFSILGLLHANTNGFFHDSNARSEDSSDALVDGLLKW
jgi:hypothetical protein